MKLLFKCIVYIILGLLLSVGFNMAVFWSWQYWLIYLSSALVIGVIHRKAYGDW